MPSSHLSRGEIMGKKRVVLPLDCNLAVSLGFGQI